MPTALMCFGVIAFELRSILFNHSDACEVAELPLIIRIYHPYFTF